MIQNLMMTKRRVVDSYIEYTELAKSFKDLQLLGLLKTLYLYCSDKIRSYNSSSTAISRLHRSGWTNSTQDERFN